jgi:hypothetical protein
VHVCTHVGMCAIPSQLTTGFQLNRTASKLPLGHLYFLLWDGRGERGTVRFFKFKEIVMLQESQVEIWDTEAD